MFTWLFFTFYFGGVLTALVSFAKICYKWSKRAVKMVEDKQTSVDARTSTIISIHWGKGRVNWPQANFHPYLYGQMTPLAGLLYAILSSVGAMKWRHKNHVLHLVTAPLFLPSGWARRGTLYRRIQLESVLLTDGNELQLGMYSFHVSATQCLPGPRYRLLRCWTETVQTRLLFNVMY